VLFLYGIASLGRPDNRAGRGFALGLAAGLILASHVFRMLRVPANTCLP